MNWFCVLNAGAKVDYSAPTCHRYQCQMCIDYQAGLIKPAFPVPAIPYQVKSGIAGEVFAVFRSNYEAEQWEYKFPHNRIASFGQYENAYQL